MWISLRIATWLVAFFTALDLLRPFYTHGYTFENGAFLYPNEVSILSGNGKFLEGSVPKSIVVRCCYQFYILWSIQFNSIQRNMSINKAQCLWYTTKIKSELPCYEWPSSIRESSAAIGRPTDQFQQDKFWLTYIVFRAGHFSAFLKKKKTQAEKKSSQPKNPKIWGGF